ncbi:MAG: cupin domain-containing protein [Alphaproteobacteria bacterium]|nr:MAG: cupin domain-containing protein [Alphaproteobacteria bacterium]
MTAAFPAVPADPGVTRQVLADHPQMMVVSFRFETGARGLPHHHPHVQSTYVRSGRFLFSVEGEEVEIGPGDSLVIPADATHGCLCREAGELIDCFTPRRDDFL